MGAWGAKTFENDSALDWVAELEAEGTPALRRILRTVAETDEREYLDLDDGAPAIAAAEIVAAARGKGRDRIPSDLIAWLDENADEIAMDDLVLASRAIERVLGANSELRDLWDEAGADTAWHSDVSELRRRVDGDPAHSRSVSAANAAQRKPDAVGETGQQAQWKSALLAFLQARGLEPDDQQLERIRASRDDEAIRLWLARVIDASSIDEVLGEGET
jgi:hypothetical protein